MSDTTPEPEAPVEMEFEHDEENNSLATQVGTAGWPEGAENDPPAEDA